jgi:hypothetical protein
MVNGAGGVNKLHSDMPESPLIPLFDSRLSESEVDAVAEGLSQLG